MGSFGTIPNQVFLSAPLVALLLGVCAFSVLTARPEWPLGIYLGFLAWSRQVWVGPIVPTWMMLTVIYVSLVMYMAKRRRIEWVGTTDHWILLWMAIWWAWIFLLYFLFRPAVGMTEVVIPLVLYIIAPMPAFLLFGDDPKRIQGFATAFIATMMVGGWEAFHLLGLTLGDLAGDPLLTGLAGRVRNFGLSNYHFFAYGMALSTIFATVIFVIGKGLPRRALALCAAIYCGYFLFQAGSRQSLGATGVALLVLMVCGLAHGKRTRTPTLVIAVPLILAGLYMFQNATQLFVRGDEQSINEAFDVVGARGWLWHIAFNYWLQSPVWGFGFLYGFWAHNVFIGTLVDQGIVGMIFLLGFLVFLLRRIVGQGVGAQSVEQAMWRYGMSAVVVFGLVHAQASGKVTTLWYLYWAGAIMWALSRSPDAVETLPAPAARPAVPARDAGTTLPAPGK